MNFYEYTRKELLQKLLFHGTSEHIEGSLRGGGYDNILWTAESPSIAQNYISECGIEVFLSKPMDFRLKEVVRPKTTWDEIAEMMGYKLRCFEENERGAVSFAWEGEYETWPKLEQVVKYLEETMGYQANRYNTYRVKCSIENGKYIYYNSDYKLQGELFIFTGKENLNIFDYAKGREGDLQNPDHNKFSLFTKALKEGYDGIKINDFAQSKIWGNLGHESIGLFPKGIEKLQHFSIPATNFDWPKGEGSYTIKETPEFITWHENEVRKAIQEGKEIPSKVLEEYNND